MRITYHASRRGTNGVYRAGHNDRQNISAAEHINSNKSSDNIYYVFGKNLRNLSFEEAERLFYKKMFRATISKHNDKVKKKHPERTWTADTYRKSAKTCPDEIIIALGRKGDEIESEKLRDIVLEMLNWQTKNYPNIRALNFALHVDELGVKHVHIRQTFMAKDADGDYYASIKDCLKQYGIDRPRPDKPESRYNNSKITYTAMTRAKIIEYARAYGYEIEDKPRERSKSGLSLLEYQAKHEEERLAELQTKIADTELNAAIIENAIAVMSYSDYPKNEQKIIRENYIKNRPKGVQKSAAERFLSRQRFANYPSGGFAPVVAGVVPPAPSLSDEDWRRDWLYMTEADKDAARLDEVYHGRD